MAVLAEAYAIVLLVRTTLASRRGHTLPSIKLSPALQHKEVYCDYLLPSVWDDKSSLRGLTVRGGFLRPAGAMLAKLGLRLASFDPAPQHRCCQHL